MRISDLNNQCKINLPKYQVKHPTFSGMSEKPMRTFPAVKPLKQVQGDSSFGDNCAYSPHCHAELVSASDRRAKLHPTFGLSGKSSQSFPTGKTLPSRDILHEIKNLSQNLTFSQLSFGRVAKAVKPVQGDSLYYRPNINYRVSFGALKKNQFDGIDLAVVEKFKAPIEKFNSNDDLQNWAKEQAESIADTDFGGRQKQTQIHRKSILKEWSDYVLKENDAYNNATALLILNAITKDIKDDNDKLPPVLNKGVLADCISEIDKNTKADRKYQFDLNQMYEAKLRALYIEDLNNTDGKTGWVVIPSKDNDTETFAKNVEKLKTLSHRNWCTKSFNAKPYLSDGDFHIYLENGKPKLGLRFVGDKIQEIQGELNNRKIPFEYFDELKKHIDENKLQLNHNAKNQFESTQRSKQEIDRIKKDLKKAIMNNDVIAIFEYFGILKKQHKTKSLFNKISQLFNKNKTDNQMLTILKYEQPSMRYSFSDLGIDENMLFERVKRVEGDIDFYRSDIKCLKNLESIGGYAHFSFSNISDLGKLKSIEGNADFGYHSITDLGNLEYIGGNANFYGSQVTDLGNLESIGGNVYFKDSQITSLGKLKTIGGNAHFNESQITDLGNLETIEGDADFSYSQITNLGKLKSIKGIIFNYNSKLKKEDFKEVSKVLSIPKESD